MENKRVNLIIKKNGKFIENLEVDAGTRLGDIGQKYDTDPSCRILVVSTGNRIRELSDELRATTKSLDFLTAESFEGFRAIERALSFILVRAVGEIAGAKSVIKIEHALDKGLFCEIEPYLGWLDEEMIEKIKERMQFIIAADEPFEKFKMQVEDAKKILSNHYDPQQTYLLDFRDKKTANVYRCGWCWDYYYGALPLSTGFVPVFDLVPLEYGALLRLPDVKNPRTLPRMQHDRMMFEMYSESNAMLRTMHIPYVSALDRAIIKGKERKLVQVSEAVHEKKIAQIADSIMTTKKRVVLIAGPSSSGKTSFAQRLAVQLNVHGIKVTTISTDDYFIDRNLVQKDEEGNYLFEELEAVDVELFNSQLNAMLKGEEVDVPVYDFIEGVKKFGTRKTQLLPNETIIIEGIHGLNDALTPNIRPRDKFKIYISPLTALGIDSHNRIPASDARLFRRLVRDSRTRGRNASVTLLSWKDVRAGEEKNIFPYQEEADVMFNSALPYELAVLKKYAKPLLEEVGEDDEAYTEASRLLKLLSYFMELPDESAILNNSLLKEFIGGSCLFKE